MTTENMTAEAKRLQEDSNRTAHWRRWGSYLSDRQWGTVREDYSPDGTAWDYFSHDQARSRAYRWGEDGIAGISDNHQRLCFAIGLWNGEDPILKERLFGLTGSEGNHGEDVKEYYFYLDNTPTHSYMKMLYKYPHQAFPYAQLVEENRRRNRSEPEFELLHTGIFEDDRYFDVFIEYAKQSAEDILIQITVINRGSESKTLHVSPTLWFRNTWSWNGEASKPTMQTDSIANAIIACHPTLGNRWLYAPEGAELLFTENETNYKRLFGTSNASGYVKDGINDYIVQGDKTAINPDQVGTKAAVHCELTIAPHQTKVIQLRFSDLPNLAEPFGDSFNATFAARKQEADEFYQAALFLLHHFSEDMRNVQRQSVCWYCCGANNIYHYIVYDWLNGDRSTPRSRHQNANVSWAEIRQWDHLPLQRRYYFHARRSGNILGSLLGI